MKEKVCNRTALGLFAAVIIGAVVTMAALTVQAIRLQVQPFQYSSDSDSTALTVEPRTGHIVSPQAAAYANPQVTAPMGRLQ